jgi:hypothetical protein
VKSVADSAYVMQLKGAIESHDQPVREVRLGEPIDLRPHVRVVAGAREVPLSEAKAAYELVCADGEFHLNLPPLVPLTPPVLRPGQCLKLEVPEELEDMTDLELGETQVTG